MEKDKITVRCACGRRFRADAANAGRRVSCPECGQSLEIWPEGSQELRELLARAGVTRRPMARWVLGALLVSAAVIGAGAGIWFVEGRKLEPMTRHPMMPAASPRWIYEVRERPATTPEVCAALLNGGLLAIPYHRWYSDSRRVEDDRVGQFWYESYVGIGDYGTGKFVATLFYKSPSIWALGLFWEVNEAQNHRLEWVFENLTWRAETSEWRDCPGQNDPPQPLGPLYVRCAFGGSQTHLYSPEAVDLGWQFEDYGRALLRHPG